MEYENGICKSLNLEAIVTSRGGFEARVFFRNGKQFKNRKYRIHYLSILLCTKLSRCDILLHVNTDGGCDGVSNCQQTRLCQAVVGLGLVVECSVCSLGDNVSWVTPQEGPHMSNNRTLTLNVSQTVTAKGYFNCSCGSTHQNMSFNVTVENKGWLMSTQKVTVCIKYDKYSPSVKGVYV